MKIRIEVRAGANEEKVEPLEGGLYLVAVKAPRSRGKANEAVLKALKRYFKKQVRIVSGATSTIKIIEVDEE